MRLKREVFYHSQIVFLALLLLVGITSQLCADEKKKLPVTTPSKPTATMHPGKPQTPTGRPQTPQKKKSTPTSPKQTPPIVKHPDRTEPGPESKPKKSGSENPKASHPSPLHTTQEGDKRITRDDKGNVRVIEGSGLKVRSHLHGGQDFMATHNRRVLVGMGPHRGYVQRAYYTRNGQKYFQRTYIAGGRRYAVAYRSYNFNGAVYYSYVPAFYFHPAFYGWAYNPWAAPVFYNWGWLGAPWFTGYAYYFSPYPSYASASLWLTDYLLAENLQLAYAAQMEAVASEQSVQTDGGAPQVALSPEVKQMIAEEVQSQLQAGKSVAQTDKTADETPEALAPAQRVFIVASNLDLEDNSGGECQVTPGDVLLRTGKTPDANNQVTITVESSKQGDCAVETESAVEVSELQEMHNEFREKLYAGLNILAVNQGKNGLPSAPDAAATSGEVAPPTPDSDAEAQLQQQQQNIDQMEQQMAKAVPVPVSPK